MRNSLKNSLASAFKWIGAIIGFALGIYTIYKYLKPTRTELILLLGFIGLVILALAQLIQTSHITELLVQAKSNPGNPDKNKIRPTKKSTEEGAIGGGIIGGIIGTMIAPGIGTIIGGIIGAFVGKAIQEEAKKSRPK